MNEAEFWILINQAKEQEELNKWMRGTLVYISKTKNLKQRVAAHKKIILMRNLERREVD
ncbi:MULTISPECIES: hypothetical protein [Bacillus]|uniref:hypothetical protein n=1 Tax=Bacillus TaxID=1386 RepID=UPI0013EF0DA9|nr:MULTISPECIES: hypothetical protein [Bacillus]UIN46121.1 hypothetical protein LXN06_21060 [Bacillus licheniformis]MCY7799790.1 hypothetical protein [Bacillus haynesii]MCY7837166.1 hypothetical protein [Bacillus haynesii]MCY7844191.1 hypothetical protein [Bacillus haynesii]MCY8016170.1 hypothetical protein [Bacillus haynesii]